MSVRFDSAAPYEVDEVDAPFARPEGQELLARVYRPRGEPGAPLAALVDVYGCRAKLMRPGSAGT